MIDVQESAPASVPPSTGRSSPVPWLWVVGLCLLSGAAALGHQLLWTRRLIDLLGASAESSARVFGVFFLGLALGSAAACLLVRKARRPWRWMGVAEIVILVLAIPVYLLPVWSAGIWPALGPNRIVGLWGSGVKLGLSIALILPPAFIMGWFLPLLAAAALGERRTLQAEGVSAYGWNTFGGVAGLVLTAGIFLPMLGAGGAAAAVLTLNLVTAIGCFWLDARSSGNFSGPACNRGNEAQDVSKKESGNVRVGLLGLSFLSGFGVLALEIVGLQMLMLVAPLSFYAPAGILLCVILVLAVAAFGAGRLRSKISTETLVVGSLLGTGFLAASLPLVFYFVASFGGGFPPAAYFSLFLLRLSLFVLLVCGPVFLVAGMLFPLLTAWSGDKGGDARGMGWGRILAVNGIGGLLGAEVAYRVLLPGLGPYGSAWAIGVGYALAGLCAAILAGRVGSRSLVGALGALATVGVVVLLHGPVSSLSLVNPHMRFQVLDERSGREGVLAVVEREDLGRGLLVYNQYMLGTTSVQHDQARQAHLPLLLHPAPEQVAFIGLATGITPGAALQHAATGEVTAIELSSMVAQAAKDHFGEYNYGLFDDPRTKVVLEDGRTYIAAARERFDVVVGDLFLPWGPGEARLYSREHFLAVRDSLRAGGLFCQWLALYQLTPGDLEIIIHTFQEAFPEVHLFVNTFRPESPALALVGFRGGEVDWAVVERRVAAERGNGGVGDPLMRHAAGLQLLYLGQAPDKSPGPINTLNNLRIELSASRGRVTGNPSQKYINGMLWLELTDSLRSASRAKVGRQVAERMEVGRLLTRNEVLLRTGAEPSRSEERQLRELFPLEILGDPAADWAQWPGVPLRL